jgi:hypothetical protein
MNCHAATISLENNAKHSLSSDVGSSQQIEHTCYTLEGHVLPTIYTKLRRKNMKKLEI